MEWTGKEEVFRKMDAFKVRAHLKVAQTVKTGALLMATRAKMILTENKHVKTGNLRRSVTGEANIPNPDVIDGLVGTAVHYAPYVEALPDGGYLYRAVREKFPEVKQMIENEMRSIL